MAGAKVRCPQCGAKNNLATRCRICGGMLPGGLEHQQEVAAGTDTFLDLVEVEREAWRDYEDGKTSAEARSRRPEELPKTPHAIELPFFEEKKGWLRRR
jgi:hypothetical protein